MSFEKEIKKRAPKITRVIKSDMNTVMSKAKKVRK